MAAVLGLIIGVVIGVFVKPDIPIDRAALSADYGGRCS